MDSQVETVPLGRVRARVCSGKAVCARKVAKPPGGSHIPRSVSAAALAHGVEVKGVCSHANLPGFHFRHSHRLHGPYVTPLASVSCEVGLLIIAATFQGGCRDEIQDRIESL